MLSEASGWRFAKSSVALSLVLSQLALAQSPLLTRAKAKVEDLDYSAANRLLKQAAEEQGTTRAELLQILELQGVTGAALGHAEDSERSFRELLLLEPSFKLAKRWGPEIQTSFFAAKAWLDDQQPMSLVLAPPQIIDGSVVAVQVQVGYDPLEVLKAVRFHVLNPGAPPSVETRQVHAPGKVSVAVRPTAAARFWVETLGAHGEVLQELGTKESPLVEQIEAEAVSTPPLVAPPPPPATRANETLMPLTSADANASGATEPAMRPVAYTLAAVGAAALITGVIFGVLMGNTNQQLTGATTNGQGTIVGITQVQAHNLAAQASTDATVADIALIGGAALAAAGIGVFIWGTVDPSPVHTSGTVGVTAVW